MNYGISSAVKRHVVVCCVYLNCCKTRRWIVDSFTLSSKRCWSNSFDRTIFIWSSRNSILNPRAWKKNIDDVSSRKITITTEFSMLSIITMKRIIGRITSIVWRCAPTINTTICLVRTAAAVNQDPARACRAVSRRFPNDEPHRWVFSSAWDSVQFKFIPTGQKICLETFLEFVCTDCLFVYLFLLSCPVARARSVLRVHISSFLDKVKCSDVARMKLTSTVVSYLSKHTLFGFVVLFIK